MDMFSLLLFRSHPIQENTLSARHTQVIASLDNVGYSSFLTLYMSREFLSASKGSFWYALQQLSISRWGKSPSILLSALSFPSPQELPPSSLRCV